ncbi:AUX/IAA domain - like 9 [Theobroma cacao]|nr:AUX/IAA domain - like 9 [Theobroma cacao]
MEGSVAYENDLNLKATELRLGLPGTDEREEQPVSNVRNKKRPLQEADEEFGANGKSDAQNETAPPAKWKLMDSFDAYAPYRAQIVGWPPIRSYRKNNFQPKKSESDGPGIYVKVSMDGAPYLRKIDLKVYTGYAELLQALENMFKFTIGKNI